VPFATSVLLLIAAASVTSVQAPDRSQAEAQERRANARLLALTREAEVLAAEQRTILGELRRHQVERQLHLEKLELIRAEMEAATGQIELLGSRAETLQRQIDAERPRILERHISLYKLGNAGYSRILLSVGDPKEAARAYRLVGALANIDRHRVERHMNAIRDFEQARGELLERHTQLAILQRDAEAARAGADKAISGHARLVSEIGARRDLNAQLAGELQLAHSRLQAWLTAPGVRAGDPPPAIPLSALRGDLDWPVRGRVLSRSSGGNPGAAGNAMAGGIEIAAVPGTPVLAVHDGTVTFAEPFTGFGNLVIIDHGANSYSLYGHLSSLAVADRASVVQGNTVGVVGTSPAGVSSLYFMLRIDDRPVDPVQWLKQPQP
jgi:murein hydrolase activator